MTDPVPIARISNRAEIAEMASALRDWEPHLDLDVVRDEPMLYEPDGTFYGVALSLETTLTVRHKPRRVCRGDAIVVPQSVAVDADPEVSLLVIRHDGVPPVHFRERFIQTWGMDHFPLNPPIVDGPRVEVIPSRSARFRLRYDVVEIANASVDNSTGLNLHLFVVLNGRGRISIDERAEQELEPDRLTLVPMSCSYRIDGSVRIGRLILDTELAYEARQIEELAQNPSAASPEYRTPI